MVSVPLRIGLFGGTFDPPHVGHLVTAVNVRHELQLDVVLLMVANEPWQKVGSRPISPAPQRLAMVRAAVVGVDGVEASDLEIVHGGPSYTADTLASLRQMYPDASLHTIMGHDAACRFLTWERHGEVASLSELVVVERPGACESLPDGYAWHRVEVPHLEVSSTDLRDRAADGRPLDFLVPAAVQELIFELGLYQEAG